ncbi:hypothetical protein [Wielerella bovis]|uniref:hypothetical protein n=1 Tax=Wielerella bovis TaxID=2917790 RepID=UPI002019C15C|nr:hypothetical protein [Wielerella bovis]ULJ64683.1 hypothetical protein MIS33_11280 [Wielerella bovis]ULJ66955.1 hypothetical protein MIS31_12170 [Wielerella bovis]
MLTGGLCVGGGVYTGGCGRGCGGATGVGLGATGLGVGLGVAAGFGGVAGLRVAAGLGVTVGLDVSAGLRVVVLFGAVAGLLVAVDLFAVRVLLLLFLVAARLDCCVLDLDAAVFFAASSRLFVVRVDAACLALLLWLVLLLRAVSRLALLGFAAADLVFADCFCCVERALVSLAFGAAWLTVVKANKSKTARR